MLCWILTALVNHRLLWLPLWELFMLLGYNYIIMRLRAFVCRFILHFAEILTRIHSINFYVFGIYSLLCTHRGNSPSVFLNYFSLSCGFFPSPRGFRAKGTISSVIIGLELFLLSRPTSLSLDLAQPSKCAAD